MRTLPFRWWIILFTATLCDPLPAVGQIKAFPQAEGFGAAAAGGRGGDVYHVTLLTDTGTNGVPGELRHAIRTAPSSGRTIVFDVGGWINLTSKLGVDSNIRNLTIAGQTAPGGIGVRGSQFSVGGDDVVVRHMRFRPGKGAGSNNDSINTNENAQRVIYDHISAEFSTDGGFDLQADQVTLQYSSVSYGLISHSTGALIQSPSGGAAGELSFHHNLFAHNETRNPKARSEIIDWRDNVVYNYHNGFIAGDSETNVNPNWRANFDGNTYISNSGGNSGSGGRPMMTGGRTQNYDLYYGVNALDRDGNSLDNPITYSREQAMANQSVVSSAYNWFTTPFDAPEVWQNADPAAAYQRVLAEFGATPWARDEVNARLAGDVVNRTGSRIERESDLAGISNGGFGTLGGVGAPLDSDGDGIPDWWEIKHGTDPFTPSNNGDFDYDGYTDLEEYLNDLAAFKAIGPLEFSGIGRYADWARWTRRWEPSRLDDAHINDGAAFVDAVGQKAGNIRLGMEPGNEGRLYVTSGWLEVTQDVVVGGAGAGTGRIEHYGGELRVLEGSVEIANGAYHLRGGMLSAPLLTKQAGGEFHFTGGVLAADTIDFDLAVAGGTLAAGVDAVGTTQINGNLAIDSGVLAVDVGGVSAADQFVVVGDVLVGGNLVVSLLGAYMPAPGQMWEILTANSINGQFDSITTGFDVQLLGSSLWLVAGAVGAALAIPEPSSLAILLMAAIGLAAIGRRRGIALAAVAALAACPVAVDAATLPVIADAELSENGVTGIGDTTDFGSGDATAMNARWNFSSSPANRNEWIALKFDLGDFTDKTRIQDVALRTYMQRSNSNNTKPLRLYALTPGTPGENWDEATITYGSMPGFTYDNNSSTNILDVGGAIQNLGAFGVSGVESEGNLALINPASLTSFVQGMGNSDLLTLLISFDAPSNGQWRIMSREATTSETGVLTGSVGTFAPFLDFTIDMSSGSGVRGDYNDNGIVDAADYVVWRDSLGGTGLVNEEVSPPIIDIADYLYWRERFGATDSGAPAISATLHAVPEPSTLALLLGLIVSLIGFQRRSCLRLSVS